MVYTYYDYLDNYYDNYYQEIYWPQHYDELYNGSYIGTYPPSRYQNEMPLYIVAMTPVVISVGLLCALLCASVAVILSCKTFNGMKRDTIPNKMAIILPLVCVWAYVALTVVDALTWWVWYVHYEYWAHIIETASEVCWAVTKLLLYATFIHRYYLIFRSIPGTSENSVCHVFSSFAVAMCIQTILSACLIVLDGNSTIMYIAIAFTVVDFFLLATLTFLMCNSVLQVLILMERLKNTSPDDSSSQSAKLNNLLDTTNKILTTGTISMLSTVIVQVMYTIALAQDSHHIFWIDSLWAVDSFISSLCVYMSLGMNQRHYDAVCIRCCKLHKCASFIVKKIISYFAK